MLIVVMMTALTSLVAPEVVTSGATNDDKVGIMITVWFRYMEIR